MTVLDFGGNFCAVSILKRGADQCGYHVENEVMTRRSRDILLLAISDVLGR